MDTLYVAHSIAAQSSDLRNSKIGKQVIFKCTDLGKLDNVTCVVGDQCDVNVLDLSHGHVHGPVAEKKWKFFRRLFSRKYDPYIRKVTESMFEKKVHKALRRLR